MQALIPANINEFTAYLHPSYKPTHWLGDYTCSHCIQSAVIRPPTGAVVGPSKYNCTEPYSPAKYSMVTIMVTTITVFHSTM